MKRYVAIIWFVCFGVVGHMDYQDQLLRGCKAKQPNNIEQCMEQQ